MKPSHLLFVTTIATGTLYVVSFVVLGSERPTIETGGPEVVSWLTENGTRARTYAWLSALVSMGFTVLGGLLASVMPRPHRYIFLGGALGFAVTAQVQAWFWAGLAFHPQDLHPGTARVLLDITQFWGPVVNASMVAMAAPVAALGIGSDPIVPRWLAWLSAVFGVEQAIETITVFGRSGFIAPGGAMNVYLGGVLGFLFVVGLLVWAMPRLDRTAQAT